jgi:hypothetical protein
MTGIRNRCRAHPIDGARVLAAGVFGLSSWPLPAEFDDEELSARLYVSIGHPGHKFLKFWPRNADVDIGLMIQDILRDRGAQRMGADFEAQGKGVASDQFVDPIGRDGVTGAPILYPHPHSRSTAPNS